MRSIMDAFPGMHPCTGTPVDAQEAMPGSAKRICRQLAAFCLKLWYSKWL